MPNNYRIIFLIAVFILTGTLGFGLGRLSKIEEGIEPVKIINSKPANSGQAIAALTPTPSGPYVASKNGTRYYLINCSGTQKIKEENKVYFASREAAEKAGLKPAVNCPGL